MSVATMTSRLLCFKNIVAIIFIMPISLMFFTRAYAETDKVLAKASPIATKPTAMGGESVLSVVLSLILVVAVIFVLAWVMRRMGGTTFRSNSFLKIIGGVSMGARERIVLVQVGDEQLLLGVAPGRIQTLHKLERPLESNDARELSGVSFSDRLKSIVNKEK